jgi:hypothetical protein
MESVDGKTAVEEANLFCQSVPERMRNAPPDSSGGADVVN